MFKHHQLEGLRLYYLMQKKRNCRSPLNIGQPDIETPKPFWDAVKSYDEKVLAYGLSDGFLN